MADIHTADQLERLARAGNKGVPAHDDQIQQPLRQGPYDFMFTNERHTTQPSGAAHGQNQPQPDISSSDLVSVGLFEQQPAPELALFLYGLSVRYHSLNLTKT